MRFLALVLLLLSTHVTADWHDDFFDMHADTIGVYYGLYTDHLLDSEIYNEKNDVVLLQWNGWTAGTMRNSHYERSYLLTWSFWSYRKNFRDAGLYLEGAAAAGLVTGYAHELPSVGGLSPLVAGTVDLGKRIQDVEFGIRGVYIPLNVVNVGLFFNYRF